MSRVIAMAIGGSPIPTCSLTHLKGISYLNHQTCPGESRGDRPYYKSSRLSQGNLYVSYQKQGKIRLQVFMMERPSAAGRPAWREHARASITTCLWQWPPKGSTVMTCWSSPLCISLSPASNEANPAQVKTTRSHFCNHPRESTSILLLY